MKLKAICQHVSYFLSCWYFFNKSGTNLPVIIPPQQLRSIQVESFRGAMFFSAEIWQVRYVLCGLVRVMWHSCSLVRAMWRLDSCLCFVFRGSYRTKILIWSLQSWADSFLFLPSRSDSFISPKNQFVEKNKTSLVHVRLLSRTGSGSSAIFEHKNIHTMHF